MYFIGLEQDKDAGDIVGRGCSMKRKKRVPSVMEEAG